MRYRIIRARGSASGGVKGVEGIGGNGWDNRRNDFGGTKWNKDDLAFDSMRMRKHGWNWNSTDAWNRSFSSQYIPRIIILTYPTLSHFTMRTIVSSAFTDTHVWDRMSIPFIQKFATRNLKFYFKQFFIRFMHLWDKLYHYCICTSFAIKEIKGIFVFISTVTGCYCYLLEIIILSNHTDNFQRIKYKFFASLMLFF